VLYLFESNMNYFLYIIYSESIDQFYIGISSNPDARLLSHNISNKGWTKRGRPWKLAFKKEFENKAIAQKWERFVKNQKRRDVIKLIITGKFDWSVRV
jgi:putative endonuclease